MARQQARLASCRLNAFRLGDYYPKVTLHIGSIQAFRPGGSRGIVIDKSVTISEGIDEIPSTASFKVWDCTSPPQQGESVLIGQGSADHRIFGGHVISCDQDQAAYVYRPTFTVRCQDNQRLFNRRKITSRFLSTDAGEIIRVLVSSWTSGFTTAHVKGTLGQIDEIEFTREIPSQAMSRIMQRVGGRWYLDERNDLHAFTGEEPGLSPAAAILSTGKHWSHHHTRDISQVRTKVAVRGAGHATTDPTILGSTLIFLDDSELLTGAQTISAGRFYYNVASVNRTAAPWFIVLANSLGVGGLQEGLPTGTPFNVYAVAQSTTYQNSIAALEGGDGVHEHDIIDGRMTQAGALQRAQAELTLFGVIEYSGTYTTRDPSAQAGRQITLNVASPAFITGITARIQRVTVSKFEESTKPWSATRVHKFPQRQVQYSSAALRDVYQILGDFERGTL